MNNKRKIIRATTVPMSLTSFCTGLLKELSERYEVVAVSSPGKELQQIHESDKVRTIAVPMERRISLFRDLRSLWQMICVFHKEKPYLVHSMTPKAGLICMIAAWICRVPRRVHTFTGLMWPTALGWRRKILMLTDKILCACATHIIPEGEGVKDDLQSYITKKNMRVLGYGNVRGIDLEYWKITPDINLEASELRENNGFTFIFVGRLVGDKGVNELIEAFCKLNDEILNLQLLLIGPTEDKLDPLKSITWDRIHATPSIIEVGPIWGRKILKFYAASDCFVLPSYREGFPNTPIEAGAMNLPCIVTDINGSREIIEDGKNGLIVPPKDVAALYTAMFKMVEDKKMRRVLTENARQMVALRFDQRFVRKCLYDFYDELIPG